jgi:hypothetical protein
MPCGPVIERCPKRQLEIIFRNCVRGGT